MSSSRERDLENLQDFISHLAVTRFCGTVLVSFSQGAPTSVSRKEEMDPEALHRFLHRPVPIKRPKSVPAPAKEPEKAPVEGTPEPVPTPLTKGGNLTEFDRKDDGNDEST